MTQQMPKPRKHPSEFEVGEEFEPIEYVVTSEMVNYLLIGINDRHPWYFEDSPFGGPVAPPLMCQMAFIRLRTMYMWGDFIGAVFTHPAGLHYMFNAEYFDPLKVGETIIVKGKCSANYINRGRRYVDYETLIYGEDGRLCTRYVSTSMPQFRKEGE